MNAVKPFLSSQYLLGYSRNHLNCMEPEALSPLLMQPTPFPYAKHIIESTFLRELSPTSLLKFSSRIRRCLLNSLFRFSRRKPCPFFVWLEAYKIIINTILTTKLGNLKQYTIWNNDDIGLWYRYLFLCHVYRLQSACKCDISGKVYERVDVVRTCEKSHELK
jgi:hypothetical protein